MVGMLRTELTVATPMKPKANQGTPLPALGVGLGLGLRLGLGLGLGSGIGVGLRLLPALAFDPFVFWPMPR